MRKRKVALLMSLVMTFVFVCTATNSVSLANSNQLNQVVKQEISKTGYQLESSIINTTEYLKVLDKVQDKKDYNEVINPFLSTGYQLEEDHQIESISITDEYTGETAMLLHQVLEKNEKEIVFFQFIYLPDSDMLLSYRMSKINTEDGKIIDYNEGIFDDFNTIKNINSGKINVNNGYESNALNLPSFPSWMCWMGSAVACGVYCTGIGLIALPAGAVCSVVCGAMFHAACSGY